MTSRHRPADAVTLAAPGHPAHHAVVRAFVVATCETWSVGAAVAEDCAIAVGEALAWAADDRVTVSMWCEPDGRAFRIACAAIRAPEAPTEEESLRVDLLDALVTGATLRDGELTMRFAAS